MYKLVISLLLLSSLVASAQYEKIDSLKYLLVEGSPDSIKMKTYLGLSYAYYSVDLDTSLMYSQMSYDLASKNNLLRDQCKAKGTQGRVYFEQGNLDDGLNSFKFAMEIAQSLNDSNLISNISNWIGLFYWKKGENEKAIKYFQDSYTMAEQTNNSSNLLYCTNNLGLISMENERYDEAIIYFNKVITMSKKQNNKTGLGLAYLNIGVVNLEIDSLNSALEHLLMGKKIAQELNSHSHLAKIYFNIASVFHKQGKYEEAIQNANKGVRISKRNHIIGTEVICLRIKAQSLQLNQQNKLAIETATQGLALAKKAGLLNTNLTYFQTLSDASEELKDYKKALFWQKKYVETRDSVYTKEKLTKISQLEISFQSKQKDLENERLKTEKESQALIIDQQTRMSFAYSAIVLLLLGFLFLLYMAKRKTKSMNKVLSEKVKERTDELEIINSQLMRSNDELKSFAFISSHDLKEPLRNIGGFISLIKRRLEQKEYDNLEEYITYVEKGNGQLNQLVDSIREYSKLGSFASHPMDVVDLNDCVNYIQSLMSDEIKDKKAKIVFDPLPKIYFNQSIIKIIFQKLIENGIKYNQSPYPVIRIYHEVSADKLKIVVSDNGLGIAPVYQEKIFDLFVRLHNRSDYSGSGMGLAFCKKLLINSGGTIKVNSAEGKGSQFIVTLPANIVCADSNKNFLNSSGKEPYLSNAN